MVRLLVAVGVMLTLPATAFAQSWSSVASTIWQRNAATAVTSSGVLYTVGMTSSGSTVEAYDPAANTWTQKASFGPLAADVNGTLYAAFITGDNSAMVSKFNPSTNSWTAVSTSPVAQGGYQMLSIGTKLYFITRIGSPASSSPFTIGINVFDTATSTWSVKVGQFQGASEYQDTTAAVLNGKLYFVGGKPYVVAFAQARLIEYDPNANTWTPKADLPLAIGRAGVTTVNGKLYAIGGYSGMSTVQNTTQIWDPASNTWSPGAALPTPRYSLGVAAIGSDIYAIDGFNGTVGLNTVEKLSGTTYYRIKNRWQGTYMHTEHLTGFVEVSPICATCQSAMWSIEDSGQGYVRLKNRWTGKFMHIENLTGRVQYGDILPQWDSAKWFLDDFNGNKRIRNLWQNLFVHIENLTGFAQYGTVFDTWQSAQWTFEAVQ
ncbi:MAG TPA: kelch repeat-containing protein [Polyangiaceae bacterium]|jgi:hypothetical protein